MRFAAAIAVVALLCPSAYADVRSGPVQLEFRVEAPDQKAPLISGSLPAEPLETMKYKANLSGDAAVLELSLFVRPQADGTVGVELELEEQDADGHRIAWKPALAGRRGTPMVATVRAGGITRTVTVTVR